MFAPFLVWATCARMLLSMLPVGLFFAAAAHPATAGRDIGIAAAVTVGSGVALWPAGRLLDRLGRWRGLRAGLLGGSAVLMAMAVGVVVGAPPAPLLAFGGVAGALLSPLVATPRALLPGLVEPARLPWASGIEATTLEVALVAAPVAAAVVGRAGTMAVLVTAGAGFAGAWLLFPAHPTDRGRSRHVRVGSDRSRHARVGSVRAGRGPRPLLGPRTVRLTALAGLLGVSGGLLEPGLAALPAPVPRLGTSAALLFVALGVGSAAGGLLAAHTGWPARAGHAGPLFALHAGALLAAVPAEGWARVAVLVVAGWPIAPLTSLAGLHLDRWSRPGRSAETFGFVSGVLLVATGAGQAAAAHLMAALGPRALVGLAALPALGAALAVALTVGLARPGAGGQGPV